MGLVAACSGLQRRRGRRRRGLMQEGGTLMYLGLYGDFTASCLLIKDAKCDGDKHTDGSDTLSDQTPWRIMYPVESDTLSDQAPYSDSHGLTNVLPCYYLQTTWWEDIVVILLKVRLGISNASWNRSHFRIAPPMDIRPWDLPSPSPDSPEPHDVRPWDLACYLHHTGTDILCWP